MSRTILDQLRLMSQGRAFLWAIDNQDQTVTVEVTANTDPCDVSLTLAKLRQPAWFFFWDGACLSELMDAEEASWIVDHRIQELRQSVRKVRVDLGQEQARRAV